MRIKDLFTVQEGTKVTEKAFGRVLISSVCSIILCMACLIGTTWAWFAVSIENTGNVIQIGNADVKVTVNGEPFDPATNLPQDQCTIVIENSNQTDAFDKKATLYVTLSVGETAKGYVTLDHNNGYKAVVNVTVNAGEEVSLSWSASWFPPAGTNELSGILNLLEEPESTNPSDGTEASATEGSSEPTVPATTEASSVPTEESATTEATEPTIETTVPATTETPSVPLEESTATEATESSTEATTSSTAATETVEETESTE